MGKAKGLGGGEYYGNGGKVLKNLKPHRAEYGGCI